MFNHLKNSHQNDAKGSEKITGDCVNVYYTKKKATIRRI